MEGDCHTTESGRHERVRGILGARGDEADSRVYGGIHYRFDNDASQIVCPKVSHFVFDNYMQPKDNDR